MGVQLYTVRVVYKTLGSTDYGLYTVVGGIVTMFSFLSSIMINASQRYFSIEIGKGDFVQLKKVFSLTLIIYCIIAALVLILSETIGFWLLNNKLVIPDNRISSAKWVFQFSTLSFMLTMFQVPYDAIVIAREKMNIFAYISIAEAVLKLIIVFLIPLLPFDSLINYSLLTCIVTLIITTIYRAYCLKTYVESRFKWFWDKNLFLEILSYSGWNIFGALASIGNNQGANILLNMFFGPIVNTSRGIAFQVNGSINMFVQNFMTAVKPQIIKYYAQGKLKKMEELVYIASKFSFLVFFVVSIPLIFETDFILGLWLGKLPVYLSIFIRITIFTTLFDTMAYALIIASQATGKIKKYQIVVGGTLMLNMPISYLLLKLGFSPPTVFVVALFNSGLCLFLRIYMLQKMIGFSLQTFFTSVFTRSLIVLITVYIPVYYFSKQMSEGFPRLLMVFLMGTAFTVISIYLFGINKKEQKYLKETIANLKNKHLK